MTIQNATDARALTDIRRWTIEKLLAAIEGAASEGEYVVIVEGHVSGELQSQLSIRGFSFSFNGPDTHISW